MQITKADIYHWLARHGLDGISRPEGPILVHAELRPAGTSEGEGTTTDPVAEVPQFAKVDGRMVVATS